MALSFVNNPATTGLVPSLTCWENLKDQFLLTDVNPPNCPLRFVAALAAKSRAVGDKLDWHSHPCAPTVPLLSNSTAFGLSKEIWIPRSPVGATGHLCIFCPLHSADSPRLGQSEPGSTGPKCPPGLLVAKINFLITPRKMAGDGSSTWHSWVCAKAGGFFFSTWDAA